MRTAAPTQLPLFRSEGQARLLTRLFLSFGRSDAPVAEIARELGLDPGGVAREADRLEQAGLIRSSRVGRQRHLRANIDSPYYQNQPGPPPNDLDVLVVGNPQRRALARTTRELSEELGLEVDPHVVSLADYEEGTTGFLRAI